MKLPAANLLEPWPSDTEAAGVPDHPRVKSLFARYQEQAGATLAGIVDSVQAIKQHDDDTIFDRLYRAGHIPYGMAVVLRLPKVEHLLAVLDFALDVGRTLQSFELHSLAYVVQLLATTVRSVLDEYHTQGHSRQDVSVVVEECRNYLGQRLNEWLTPPRPPASDDAWAPGGAGTTPAPTPGPVPLPETQEVGDGPEELEIPADKLGLTSEFCEEARENLVLIGHRLVELEEAAEPLPIVNDLFRSIHTLKGGARLLNVRRMETLAHRIESLLDLVRQGTQPVHPDLIDVLLDGKRLLEEMVNEVASGGPIRTRIRPCLMAVAGLEDSPRRRIHENSDQATAAPARLPVNSARGPNQAAPRPSAGPDSIRIPVEKLDDVLNTASEVFISRIRLASDVAALHTTVRQFRGMLQRLDQSSLPAVPNRRGEANRRLIGDVRSLSGEDRCRLPDEKVPALINRFYEELAEDVEQRGFSIPEEISLNLLSIDEVRKRLQKNVEHLEQLSARLQSGAMSFRMVPIAHLFDRFPTQVRDMARRLGKKVRLELSGAATELDKVLINQLTDPLLHILRNAIDHGIEAPEQRVAQRKPEAGRIILRAYYHGSQAVIEVSDDGRGIDTQRVLAKAIGCGLVEAAEAPALTHQEIVELIFQPGLSTVDRVSTLSGRGVGMDVVKTAISQVQGNITVESVLGQGTTIRMKLPLTLAVVGILLVRERMHQVAFPIQHVEEILRIKREEVRCVSANAIYNHRGATLPVTTLSAILGFPMSLFSENEVSLVILSEGDKRVGVLVDAVLGRQEVLIKNLGRLIKKAPYVMGCTILSDSRLVLILNAWEIVNARARNAAAIPPAELPPEQGRRKQHLVLIVDDSPIQRNHLSSVLKHAGYTVETAENGYEALKRLRNRRASAFCVDVAMPLMDGFEFVDRLRRVWGHASSPVFFITVRTSAAERDRAAQLGVQEFFQKPVDPAILVQALDRHCLTDAGVPKGNRPCLQVPAT
jgi:two-component system chemotaxis sensor kinase CheA